MICLPCIFVIIIAAASAQRTVPCAGGIQDGQTVEQGIYWYKCMNGQLEPQGCVSTQGQRVNVGDPFVNDKNIEITCTKADGYLKFIQTACMYKGQRILPGQSAAETDVWFTCEKAGDVYLLWRLSGCIAKGNKVAFNDQTVDGSTVFQCVRTAGDKAELIVTGCSGKNGQHMLGDQFQDDKLLYTCDMDTNNAAIERVVGCISEGQRYYDYQTFQVGQQLYRCVVAPNQAQAVPVVCGCVQRLAQKPVSQKLLGCSWEEQDEKDPTQAYLVSCKLDNQGSAYAERIRCLYSGSDGKQLGIDPGCYRPLGGDKSVGCVLEQKQAAMKIFSASSPDFITANNLQLC